MSISRNTNIINIASANAATIYNMMNFSFSGLDLSHAKLSHALL